MKRALMTGAGGFVGANLARRLLHDGHEVHVLVRPGYAAWRVDEIRADVAIHQVNFADQDDLGRAIGSVRPDWVFHLAAYGAYAVQSDAMRMVQSNVIATMNFVHACLRTGFEAFVNTGSSSEYGHKAFAPSETEWLEPNSVYAITKAAATHFCRHMARSQDVHLPTLRLYSVYGPYEEPSRLLPSLIVRGLEGRLPPLVNPAIARDFIYIDDVTDAYLRAASSAGHERGAVYNVGTGTQSSLGELVDMARRIMNISVDPNWGSMPERAWDTTTWVADNRKIRAELGWEPRYDLELGMRAMLAWFEDQPRHVTRYRECLAASE